MSKYKCPCCGKITLDSLHENDICPVCGWEDDWYDSNNPDYPGSCNYYSLNKTKEIFKSTGKNINLYHKMQKQIQ